VKILAVDTALGACSVAILSGDRVLAEQHEPMLRGHAESLAPMVERAMAAASLPFTALGRIGVTTGPGTFTGQRVGLAFARALGVALKIPVVGLTTLHVMAAETLAAAAAPAWTIIAADAKRGEIYFAAYAPGGKVLVEPCLLSTSAVLTKLAHISGEYGMSPVMAGTAVPLLEPMLKTAGYQAHDTRIRQPRALFVALLAAHSAVAGPPRPLYLRPPDAKLPGSR